MDDYGEVEGHRSSATVMLTLIAHGKKQGVGYFLDEVGNLSCVDFLLQWHKAGKDSMLNALIYLDYVADRRRFENMNALIRYLCEGRK